METPMFGLFGSFSSFTCYTRPICVLTGALYSDGTRMVCSWLADGTQMLPSTWYQVLRSKYFVRGWYADSTIDLTNGLPALCHPGLHSVFKPFHLLALDETFSMAHGASHNSQNFRIAL